MNHIKPQRIKKYKAVKPEDTINFIRNILHDLGIFVFEEGIIINYQNLFSSRIRIGSDKIWDHNIGTNGKGMTIKYALASAYGEFMERLQNNLLFNSRSLFFATKYSKKHFGFTNNDFLDFFEYPDETLLSVEKSIANKFVKYLSKIDNSINFNEKMEANPQLRIFVPFLNIFEQKQELVPIQLIKRYTGSNGFCAGNTAKEAIIQGISEIFERYVLKRLYFEEITPPEIPIELFSSEKVFEQINLMEKKYNLKIIVKDCSLGLGLPVIGVLMIDIKNNKYKFHLGADPSPITSLERCLTEMFQGRNINDGFKELLHANVYETDKFNLNKENHFNDTITQGTGHWPKSVFGEKTTYDFSGFEYLVSENDDTDLDFLFRKIKELGYNLYIRNVSYLKFPSYYIYIPGMSENNKMHYADNSLLLTINNIKRSDRHSLQQLAEHLRLNKDFKGLFFYNLNYDINELEPELFNVMLNYYINDIENAYSSINEYIESGKNENLYFLCVRDFLLCRKEKMDTDSIKEYLMRFYDQETTGMVIKDFKYPEEIFNYYDLSNCFECQECQIHDKCTMREILTIIRKIHEKYSKNSINQMSLLDDLKMSKKAGEAENLYMYNRVGINS